MFYFLNNIFESQKIIAEIVFAIIDFLYWISVQRISKRNKQLQVFKYSVAFAIEAIFMLPISFVIAGFAISFGI